MKRLLLALTILLTVFLVGCNNDRPIIAVEYQRFRVEVVELVGDDGVEAYIVSKSGYTIGGIYMLETDEELQLGDIVYVVITDTYTAELFTDFYDELGGE